MKYSSFTFSPSLGNKALINQRVRKGSTITKYIIKNDTTTVIAIEKLYITFFLILASRLAFIEPLISRNAISATIATINKTPNADVIFVKDSDVKSEIKSETTIDGVQKTVEYFNEFPISSFDLGSRCGFNCMNRIKAIIPIIRIAPSIA